MSVTKTQQCHKSTRSINMLRNSTSSEIWEVKWHINVYNGCSNFCICRRVCVCVCVCVCTHRHSVSLEMLEGISVTSGGSWLQTDRVCSARTDSSAPGLTSVSVSGAEAAAIFIITITNIMRAIAVIVAVSHPQSRLLGFLTVQIFFCLCFSCLCLRACRRSRRVHTVCPTLRSPAGRREREILMCFLPGSGEWWEGVWKKLYGCVRM